jgi:hypothetical protein
VPLTEQGGSADEGARPDARAFRGGFKVHAAVHADVVSQLSVAPPRGRLLDFGQGLIDKVLPAETRIHRHDQEFIDLLQIRLNQCDRRGRVDRQADSFAERLDLPQQGRDLVTEFHMDIELIRARPCKRLQQDFRPRTHQMHVKENLHQRADGLHHFRAEREVRNKMSVHDVQMQPVGPRMIDPPGFPAEAREVGGQQRRRNDHGRRR